MKEKPQIINIRNDREDICIDTTEKYNNQIKTHL